MRRQAGCSVRTSAMFRCSERGVNSRYRVQISVTSLENGLVSLNTSDKGEGSRYRARIETETSCCLRMRENAGMRFLSSANSVRMAEKEREKEMIPRNSGIYHVAFRVSASAATTGISNDDGVLHRVRHQRRLKLTCEVRERQERQCR